MLIYFQIETSTDIVPKIPLEKSDTIFEKQDVVTPIGIPFAAAALPAAAAAAIGVYGTYQQDIHRIIDSFVGKKCRIDLLNQL